MMRRAYIINQALPTMHLAAGLTAASIWIFGEIKGGPMAHNPDLYLESLGAIIMPRPGYALPQLTAPRWRLLKISVFTPGMGLQNPNFSLPRIRSAKAMPAAMKQMNKRPPSCHGSRNIIWAPILSASKMLF